MPTSCVHSCFSPIRTGRDSSFRFAKTSRSGPLHFNLSGEDTHYTSKQWFGQHKYRCSAAEDGNAQADEFVTVGDAWNSSE